MSEYKVQFEVFEGPLDLLLYLIRKEEVDIYEVNLTKLASQFVEYIDLMRQFDLEVAGEFLVMASTLMYIKSRELLPVEKQVQAEEEDEGEDPRWELIRQLVEYKKFKDAAASLQNLEIQQEAIFPRQPVKIQFDSEETAKKPETGLFDLLNAVNAVLKRFQEKQASTRQIYEEQWSVSGKMEFVIGVITERGTVKFTELFATAATRSEVVCTFLALLELIRLKQLACVQPEPFDEIQITKAIPPPVLPDPATVELPVRDPVAAALADEVLEEAEPEALENIIVPEIAIEPEAKPEESETEAEAEESEEDSDDDDDDDDDDDEDDEDDDDEDDEADGDSDEDEADKPDADAGTGTGDPGVKPA